MSSITANGKCFYCRRPINRNRQPHIHAWIKHLFKHGGERQSDRNFHLTCFDKFAKAGGRPFNPDTNYKVLDSERITPTMESSSPA